MCLPKPSPILVLCHIFPTIFFFWLLVFLFFVFFSCGPEFNLSHVTLYVAENREQRRNTPTGSHKWCTKQINVSFCFNCTSVNHANDDDDGDGWPGKTNVLVVSVCSMCAFGIHLYYACDLLFRLYTKTLAEVNHDTTTNCSTQLALLILHNIHMRKRMLLV